MDLTIGPNDVGRRIDRVCRKLLPTLGLSAVYSSIRKGNIRINGKKITQSYLLRAGDTICINTTLETDINRNGDQIGKAETGEQAKNRVSDSLSVKLEPAVIFENDHFIIFNKPRGMLTHGKDSIKTYLSFRLEKERVASISFSPSPLHRLDRNTSGIVVCGKSLPGTTRFSELLRQKKIIKAYMAINSGCISAREFWEDKLKRDTKEKKTYSALEGGKAAMHIIPLLNNSDVTFSLIFPITGKTHQIRVQSAIHGYPLLGDKKYGAFPGNHRGYALHACMLIVKPDSELPGFTSVFAPVAPYFKKQLIRFFHEEEVDAVITQLPKVIAEIIPSISSV